MAVPLLLFAAACTSDPIETKPPGETDAHGDSGADTTTLPPPPTDVAPWTRDEEPTPESLSFTELSYHAADGSPVEWIELYNPMAVDQDVSGWTLSGAVTYTFPAGTRVAAGGYLVVASDPAEVAGALGPFTGQLDNAGERLDVVDNGGRRIDSVAYADDTPWPVAADGTGATLAKRTADAASDHAENWTVSAQLGGTPGGDNGLDAYAPPTTTELVAMDATWRYDTSGAYPSASWADPSWDDSGWPSADAIFYAGEATSDEPAVIRVTADNYYALYLGQADGTDLRLLAEDADGDWTTVESVDAEVGPQDLLWLAAWEAPGDNGGPQMTIAEATFDGGEVGTDMASWEYVLGPSGANPGASPPAPAPTEDDVLALLGGATWAPPAVDADRTTSTWGWAVQDDFDDAARYIWADTFSDQSVTNTEETYALFRTVSPLLGPGGTTELGTVPTTTLFRTSFTFAGTPSATTLSADCTLDDGAVVYLNGVEVLRVNMPAGAVTASTFASAPVSDTSDVYADLPTDALVVGENVLAVELHQAVEDDTSLRFGCALSARTSTSEVTPGVVFSEVAASTSSPYWVELTEAGGTAEDTDGLVLVASSGGSATLSGGTLDPGALQLVADVGFGPAEGDVLALYSADRSRLLDAIRVEDRPRARLDGTGDWRHPTDATPGATNTVVTHDDIVVSELMYHHGPDSDGVEDPEEWLELTNRGADVVDLGGWQLVDAVAFEFPVGTTLEPGERLVVARDATTLSARFPTSSVLGDYDGSLGNDGDHVLLLDADGNPADEVRYADGGRWPSAPDGGGSSLELRDLDADNSAPEAWAASDESARSTWADYSYEGVAEPSAVGPDGQWNELVLGLLDAGEVLLDDVSVVQDPDSAPVELVQNATFDDTAHWRLLGTHRHSSVETDAGESVLDLVATGPTEHMHNHAETTLTEPLGTRTYRVSFRAKWLSGSNQLNTRLYFNRLAKTTLLAVPTLEGTPGSANSTETENVGPTYSDLRQDVAVPAGGEPVVISVTVADPDGVASATLYAAVDGAAFDPIAMTGDASGRWSATVPAQDAGALAQFYVEATDTLGVSSNFPAAGPDSRALIQWDDGRAASTGLHNFRLLLTDADSDWMLDAPNRMSNDKIGATVVYDEAQVFYDVGARLKGSERGRVTDARIGYGVSFHRDEPFRGSHTSVLLDRSEGIGTGQREFLLNLVMTHAGLPFGEYNDLVQLMPPRSEHTGGAELQLDRSSDLVLQNQFPDGDLGPDYDYELVYYPLSTDDGTVEGQKLPDPDSVVGTALTDLGDDKESWRWTFELQNNQRADDYTAIQGLGRTFALSGADFLAEVPDVIDVDEWMAASAMATLAGAMDNYGGDGSQHNARFYQRPDTGLMLYYPHDLDYFGWTTMPVVNNSDLSRLLADPTAHRLYYQHLADLIGRAYTTDFLGPWCTQLATRLPAQAWSSNCQFIDDRAAYVLSDAGDSVLASYPAVDFVITTNGGDDFSTSATSVTLEGQGWIDVRTVLLDGSDTPLNLTWADDETWAVTVPLVDGENALELVAYDLGGAEVGRDSITVTSGG